MPLKHRNQRVVNSLRFSQIKQKQQNTKQIIRIGAFGLCLLGLVSIILFIIFSLRVKHIICLYENSPCTTATVEKYQSIIGTFIFLEIPHQLLSPHLTYKKLYPNTVEIRISKPTIIANSILSPSQSYYQIYEDSSVLQTSTNSSTMKIVDIHLQNLLNGDHVDTDTVLFYKQIEQILHTITLSGLIEIDITADDRVEWIFGSQMKLVTDRDHVVEEMQSLQYLLQTPTIDLSHHTVDLRFHNPVIE